MGDIAEAKGHRQPTAIRPCSLSPSCLPQPSACPRLQQSPELQQSCASTQSGSMAGTKHARTGRWGQPRTASALLTMQRAGQGGQSPKPFCPQQGVPLRQAAHSPAPRTQMGHKCGYAWRKLLGTDTTHHTHARKSWHFLLTMGD